MNEIIDIMDNRYQPNSVLMSLLRSAIDNAHKKVLSGPSAMECLNETSKFYELSIIQIDAYLKLIKEKPQNQLIDTNRKKMLTGLIKLRKLFCERANNTKCFIIEKDKELVYLRSKLEPKTLDMSDFEPKYQSSKGEDSSEKVEVDQDVIIEQMCSDIEILYRTLDLTFGLIRKDEIQPLEKQWRCSIEKETILIMMKGFIHDFKNQKRNTFDDVTKKDMIIARLMEERQELNLQTMVIEEHYMILLNDCYNEFCAYQVEKSVSEDVFVYVLHEVAKDWNEYDDKESIKMQLTEEMYKSILTETINDIKIKLDIETEKIHNESLVYKKAFARRCENLLLAETEVDLLGDQVEALQDLLRKIYFVLDQNSSLLSQNIQVMDILKLIKKEFLD